jgi:hypothetical protein
MFVLVCAILALASSRRSGVLSFAKELVDKCEEASVELLAFGDLVSSQGDRSLWSSCEGGGGLCEEAGVKGDSSEDSGEG